MSDFTYEHNQTNENLELYEWDNVWWEQANKSNKKRVLYIGDSISCATRREATKVAEESILFDGLGTSKAVDNPHFCDTIELFSKQQEERFAVLFNNGLHGWHLDDMTDYKQYYEKILKFLLEKFEKTPIFLILTTSVADVDRDKRVVVRNQAVLELAKKYNLPTIDFYQITKVHPELISDDGVHLMPAGYQMLAETLVEAVQHA